MQTAGSDDWDRAVQMRGGYVQQGQAIDHEGGPPPAPSQLADALSFLIGWGLLFPAQGAVSRTAFNMRISAN